MEKLNNFNLIKIHFNFKLNFINPYENYIYAFGITLLKIKLKFNNFFFCMNYLHKAKYKNQDGKIVMDH